MVQDQLLTFDSQRYRLLAWVVMPNQRTCPFQPMNGWTVAKIVAAWKKFTARKICDDAHRGGWRTLALRLTSRVLDRYIRDRPHSRKRLSISI